jgi:hypothetical protein
VTQRVRFVPSVKLVSLWLAEAAYLARHAGDKDGCREWADANYQEFRAEAERYLAALVAVRSEPSVN